MGKGLLSIYRALEYPDLIYCLQEWSEHEFPVQGELLPSGEISRQSVGEIVHSRGGVVFTLDDQHELLAIGN
ncbi:hypothetical protein MUP77_01500, partial [Candidatus Bathyarchaeota archaeon]|nr:hypothetical protein [Candidatus Bathyarchaeota archaeon]